MWFYDYEAYPGTYQLSTAMTSKEILQVLNVKPESENDAKASSETEETLGKEEESEDENGL